MNTRAFIRTGLLALSAAVFAPFKSPDKSPAKSPAKSELPAMYLRHIYKLDANGCNPRRVRMKDLRKGDKFMYNEPENAYVSRVLTVTGNPVLVKAPKGVRDETTWSIAFT